MKANRAPRRRLDDHAVSNVLGGILFFALVFIFLIVVQTSFVPRWEEKAEADHMGALQADIAAIKGEADRQAANTSAQPVGLPLALTRGSSTPLFSTPSLPASVDFQPGVNDIQIDASRLLIVVENGKSLAGADEVWTDLAGLDTIEDILDVEHLRLRLNAVADEDDGDSITIQITDANGDLAGRLVAYLDGDPPDTFVNTQVRRADGEVIYDQGDAFHQVSSVDFWWIDALADELHFADILAAAEAPFSLTLAENGIQGQFTITYVDSTTGGSTGSSGKLITDFHRELDGGTLTVRADNQFYPSQVYEVQAGAVVLSQGDDRVLRTPPLFSATVDGSSTHLRLTVPSLTGERAGATGSATVTLDGRNARSFSGTTPDFRFRLQTEDVDLWTDRLGDVLEDAGLSIGANEYAFNTTASDVLDLTVYGRIADPLSDTHDISLELNYASVEVLLQT